MVFSSVLFLYLFLPAVLLVYFLAPRRMKNPVLLLFSLVFYYWGEQWLIWLMLLCIGINYVAALALVGHWPWDRVQTPQLEAGGPRLLRQNIVLFLALIANLGMLAVFKYFNFAVDSINWSYGYFQEGENLINTSLRFILPLGISFYTFQAMSYTIDVYRGHVKATRSLFDVATYVSLFPQLVAGPIVRYSEVEVELHSRRTGAEDFAYGARRFIIGLGKKVLIANTVARPVDQIFDLPASDITTGMAWLGLVGYTLQIYFDFSGYSDMGIGLGRIFGFRFPENFDYPYVSQSVREFWRRWHMTLSFWFRDYVYIPLGGGRKGPIRTALNLILVFFLCGLWHGASWTFVVWGFYHGIFIAGERLLSSRLNGNIWRPVRHVYLLCVVMSGWVLFRADNLKYAVAYFRALGGFGVGTGEEFSVHQLLTSDLYIAVVAGVAGSAPLIPFLVRKLYPENNVKAPRQVVADLVVLLSLCCIMVLCSMQLASGTHNPFIYFRF